MNKKTLIIALLLSVIISLLCLGVGSIYIEANVVFKILINSIFDNYFEKNWKEVYEVIVLNVRLPRIIMGYITGASISIVGVLMQTLTKNNLSEPYILGISSGASAGAVSVIILSTTIPFFSKFTIVEGAFIGALLSTILVFSISMTNRLRNTVNLILIGVGVSAFFSALTTFIIYSSTNNSQVITAMFWMTGSLSSSTEDIILIPSILSLISLVIILVFNYELDIFLLGEASAKTLGINIRMLKIGIIVISTLLVSSIVSVTGIIGFVGLIVPHISRKIIGYKHKNLVPFSFFIGGMFLVLCDTFARTVFSPEELPIGIVTSFIGAPLFLWIIKRDYNNF